MSAHTSTSPAQAPPGYLRVLGGRWRVVVATIAVCIVAAALVLAAVSKTYTAHAQLLVTPISATSDEDFVGVPVLRDSTISPTTSVLTVAKVVKTPATLALVQRAYGGTSGESLAGDVTVTPLSQTSIVDIAATSSSPDGAARLANTFARATIVQRTAAFQRGLRATVATLQKQSNALHGGTVDAQRAALQARLAVLTPLLGKQDPTLQIFDRAAPPTSAAAPRPALTLGAAAVVGILLGLLLALLRERTDSRVRRLDHVLAELPLAGRRHAVARIGHAASRSRVAAASSVRPLVARLLGATGATTAVVVVSATEGEGRTSVAAAIARAAGRLRRRVVLADCDVAHPHVAAAFGVEPRTGNGSQRNDLVRPTGEPNVLLALPPHVHAAGQPALDTETAAQRQAELREHGDLVVVDSPAALTDPSAVALARTADAVVAVARLGHTRKEDLHELAEVLAEAGVTAAGVVVLGPRSTLVEAIDGSRAAWRRLGGALHGARAWLRDPAEELATSPEDGESTEKLQEQLAPSRRKEAAARAKSTEAPAAPAPSDS